jgi:predicted metal-dependent hydrolase
VRFGYLTAKDGNFFSWRIWRDCWRFVWGRRGMYRLLVSDYLRWYRRDFHPRQQDDRPLIEAHLARMAS